MTEQTSEFSFVKSSRKRRIAAFLIDHFVVTFLIVTIAFLVIGPEYLDENNPDKMMTIMLYVITPGFMLYFAKDSFKGNSIGKWIMEIKVRDENNPHEIPSFGRLFVRNLFLIVWPIEFIVLATSNQKQRLGDNVAKTVVVKNPNNVNKLPKVLALIGVGITFFVVLVFVVSNAMKNSDAYKVAINEIEKNTDVINETGGITGYGMMPTGNIKVSNDYGQAQFQIEVLGKAKDLSIGVYLEKEANGPWKLIEMQK